MTQQFKFGDLVSCESYPTTGVIVGLHDMGNVATVCFEGFPIPKRGIKTNSLKLIPHPDTVRLEFIAAECDSTLDELREVLDKKQ
nr:MAG TPA: hypothetical protein [Caudoviricetes sp.]